MKKLLMLSAFAMMNTLTIHADADVRDERPLRNFREERGSEERENSGRDQALICERDERQTNRRGEFFSSDDQEKGVLIVANDDRDAEESACGCHCKKG